MAPGPLPILMDDLIVDILLRLPRDDLACLARASLVCKAWRRLLADRAFLRRYREIHGAPPFLGFLYNNFSIGVGAYGPLFLRTTTPSPFPWPAPSAGSPTYCRTLDCRHGRVLLFHPAHPSSFTVWDPITGKQRCFPAPVHPYMQFTAAVLCASHGCDHLDCRDGFFSFHVVVVSKTRSEPERDWSLRQPVTTAWARFYTSETDEWTVSDTIDLQSSFSIGSAPSLLNGDAVYFMLGFGKGIFKYDLTMGVLSVINLPPHNAPNMILCTAEDGGLGVAAMEQDCSLRLLSGRTDPDGVWRWAQGRIIQLDSMIRTAVGGHLVANKFYVVGFAEGTSYIFVRANDSIFSVELKSSRINKIGTGRFAPIFPLMGFYVPDLANAKLQIPMRIE